MRGAVREQVGVKLQMCTKCTTCSASEAFATVGRASTNSQTTPALPFKLSKWSAAPGLLQLLLLLAAAVRAAGNTVSWLATGKPESLHALTVLLAACTALLPASPCRAAAAGCAARLLVLSLAGLATVAALTYLVLLLLQGGFLECSMQGIGDDLSSPLHTG